MAAKGKTLWLFLLLVLLASTAAFGSIPRPEIDVDVDRFALFEELAGEEIDHALDVDHDNRTALAAALDRALPAPAIEITLPELQVEPASFEDLFPPRSLLDVRQKHASGLRFFLEETNLNEVSSLNPKPQWTTEFHAYPFSDPATGLVYARARWYDPQTGTFLSPDPMGYVDSSNLYAFAGGDPINRRDPDGRCSACVWVYRTTEYIRSGQAGEDLEKARDAVFKELSAAAIEEFSPVGFFNGLSGALLGYDFVRDEEVKGVFGRGLSAAAAIPGVPSSVRKLRKLTPEKQANAAATMVGSSNRPAISSSSPEMVGVKLTQFPRWQPGGSITQLTEAGEYPVWYTRNAAEKANSIQGRYWMNRALLSSAGEFTEKQLRQMRAGFSPQAEVHVRNLRTGQTEIKPVRMELHHNLGNRGVPGFDEPIHLREVWPWQHSAIDHYRRTGYEFLGFVD
jgi:RHS repeat-associated protein